MRRTKGVWIDGRGIGPSSPCFIVAEAGVNHNGDVRLARRMVDVAVQAGADAVKFQTFRAERLVTKDAPKAPYQIGTTGDGESQFEMLQRLELSRDVYRELSDHCRKRGLVFLSTPFDEDSADFLAELGVAAFKIPSGELTNLRFLEHVAHRHRPIILSTGMSTLAEVEAAVRTIEQVGNRELVLLHCVSTYPADPADANLRTMKTMSDAFNVPVGFSDHTRGIEVALAAVALGACVIEKHFTLDRQLPGPDQPMSLEPPELTALVEGVRTVERALGTGDKVPTVAERENLQIVRRSLAAAVEIDCGAVLRPEMLTALRPGTGLSPVLLREIIGRRTTRLLVAGELLQWNDLE